MYKFGRNPPRLLECFGVSGLLEDSCQVYYDSLFNTRHVGQISDLLLAKLAHAQPDELKLRLLLLSAVFEAYRFQSNAGDVDGEMMTLDPLVLECGIDEEKIALGVQFSSGHGLETTGLADRVASGKPNGTFESVIASMHSQADRLLIRIVPGAQLELIALLALKGKMEQQETTNKAPPVVLVFEQEQIKEAPRATRYTELGDLDYAALLAADEPGSEQPTSPTGQILAKGCTELADALKFRTRTVVSGDASEKVSGAADLDEGSGIVRVSGTASEEEGALRLVRGGQGEQGSDRIVVSGGQSRDGEDEDRSLGESVRKRGFRGIFKKVWPFQQGEADEDEYEDAATGTERAKSAAVTGEAATPVKAKKAAHLDEEGEDDPNLEAAANSLIVEIQAGSLDRTLSRAQEEAAEIKSELQTARAKRWVDGLMGDLMSEKARLHDLAKKLNTTIRQKEIEFRNKEQMLQEEIRRRDEMLRQKNNALTRTKDQLAQTGMTMERLKAASAERSEDAGYKSKYGLMQKMLLSSKEEGAKLAAKLDDAKGQLASMQMLLKKRPAGGPELTLVKSKYERLLRQSEELRNMNDQLNARVQQLADRVDTKVPGTVPVAAAAAGVDILKKRFEAAMRLTSASQKESAQLKAQTQQLQLRVEELEREEARLNMELARSQGELKSAKTGRPGGAGGKGSGPAAA